MNTNVGLLSIRDENNNWIPVPAFIGPTGPAGDDGVYVGTSAPTDSSVKVWVKTDGTTTDFTGPTGPQGEQGPQGPTGETGAIGPTGPSGLSVGTTYPHIIVRGNTCSAYTYFAYNSGNSNYFGSAYLMGFSYGDTYSSSLKIEPTVNSNYGGYKLTGGAGVNEKASMTLTGPLKYQKSTSSSPINYTSGISAEVLEIYGYEHIPDWAFGSITSVSSVLIDETCKYIWGSAFAGWSDKSLTMLATTPPYLSNSYALGTSWASITVPYSADHSVLNAYKTANNWSAYADYIVEASN